MRRSQFTPPFESLARAEHTVAYGLAVAENPSFKALQANPDLCLRLFVAKRAKPVVRGEEFLGQTEEAEFVAGDENDEPSASRAEA